MDEQQGLTLQQAARFLGCSTSALRLWRRERRGPRCYRLGRLIRYRQADLLAYIAANVDGHN